MPPNHDLKVLTGELNSVCSTHEGDLHPPLTSALGIQLFLLPRAPALTCSYPHTDTDVHVFKNKILVRDSQMDTQTRSQRILNIGTLHEWATFPLEGTHYEVKISAPPLPRTRGCHHCPWLSIVSRWKPLLRMTHTHFGYRIQRKSSWRRHENFLPPGQLSQRQVT